MKIETYKFPKSSFLSLEKDLDIIVNMLLKNNSFKKLLYYTTPDAMNRPILTEDQSLELIGKNIKILPKLYIDPEILTYLIIRFNNFTTNATNPEFRDNTVEFDIICHYNQWMLKDYQMRPYRLAAEIDTMFNDKHLTGIGTLQFLGATQINLTDEYAGLCLLYEAIHGGEDQIKMPNPNDEQQFLDNFNELFN